MGNKPYGIWFAGVMMMIKTQEDADAWLEKECADMKALNPNMSRDDCAKYTKDNLILMAKVMRDDSEFMGTDRANEGVDFVNKFFEGGIR